MNLVHPMRRAATLAIGLLFAALLAGCAAPQTERLINTPGTLPVAYEVPSVPFFPQEENYCGPAALAMALAWTGLPVTQDDIAPQVFTPGREGTLASDMVTAARRNGRLAVPVQGLRNLLTEVAAGHPVIIFQNLSLDIAPQWHFAVLTGYDLDKREVILHSGLDERLAMSMDTFEHTWQRADGWALVVLPPDVLAATASEGDMLRAAAGLEQADQPAAAAKSYAAIAARWPDSAAPRIGEGNAHFALGDFKAAERAYRSAIAQANAEDSVMAATWNNLAYAIAKQGRRDEAIAAAKKAVSLASDDKAAYLHTLKELSQL